MGIVKCHNCEEVDHAPEAKYCHFCGAKLCIEPDTSGDQTTKLNIEWVDLEDFDEKYYKHINAEKFDLSKMLFQFDDYLVSHKDLFDSVDVSIYIEENDFKTFVIHIYDINSKKVAQLTDGFDYIIATKFLNHTNNIKDIFKYEKHGSIICRVDRIQKLQKRILDDKLTF